MDFPGKTNYSESDGNRDDFHHNHGMNCIHGVLYFTRLQQTEPMKPAIAPDFYSNKRIDIAIGAALSGGV